ncbi:hemolysin D [Arenimonas soli]|uniref:Hemolysin D n=1 Tax=Arenimonas soli TaxID=2269504 RepID=A0ABQ1HT28_9GAMM|nr:efflux RND transporter periplasmic adaptor subunit [Arenimonas soli]GGA86571.1 hemolysin D [Arenimonas soli]
MTRLTSISRRAWLPGLVLAVVATGWLLPVTSGSQEAAAPEPPPVPVDLALAVKADFAPLHWSPASVASREDARVAAETGGRVVSVAEVGTVLRRGDTLARLDDSALKLAERKALADRQRLGAQVELARRQEERYQALVAAAGISGAQLDQVVADRRMREQDLASAVVALEQARLALRRSIVRAPFDGVVVERSVELGEFLVPGAPVARLVNTQALEIRARAPVTLVSHLREGVPVSLRHQGQVRTLPLQTLVPVGDEASRQLELRVALDPGPAAEASLVVGSAVQLGVPSAAPREVLAVPGDAVVMRAEGSHVMRVGDGDLAERVPVELGASEAGLVEVRGALRPGDRLVVRGAERLQPGQRVAVPDRRELPVAALAGAPVQ